MNTKKILHVVDSLEYVTTNGFQHQLLKTLQRETDVVTVPLSQLNEFYLRDKIVLSTLKHRSLVNHIDSLKEILKGNELYAYDQDPWESYTDEGSYRGSYKYVQSKLNIVSFLTPSKWWSDHIISTGSPSSFYKIWILPEYCASKNFQERLVNVGFMGQMHPFRKQTFSTLSSLGLNVEVFPSSSYESYLNVISNMRFFVHYEPNRWHLDGMLIPCHALYGKTVEIMARGTFCLRERCVEATHWNLDKNPLLLQFSSFDELIDHVDRINSLPIEEVNQMISSGVEMIKNDIGWKSVIEVLR